MIGPKQTTNEQMSNETKPMMGHESNAESRKTSRRKSEHDERKGDLLDDAGVGISRGVQDFVGPASVVELPPPSSTSSSASVSSSTTTVLGVTITTPASTATTVPSTAPAAAGGSVIPAGIASASAASTPTAEAATATTVSKRVLVSNRLEPSRNLLICLTKKFEEVTDNVPVAAVEEGSGTTSVTGATSTTNAVNVIIDVGGKVEVDDMGDVGDIETTSGDSGGNHDGSVTLTECLKGHFTFSLGSVTMDRRCGVVIGDEEVGENVGHPLGLHEHKSQATLRLHGKDVQEDRALVRVFNVFDLLGNILGGGANTADGEEDVFLEEILGEDLDVAREGGAEHEGLALMDTRHVLSLDDTTDLVFEAHVEHAVGLVKNKVTNVGQADTTTLNEINETPRSGTQKIAAPLDLTQLGVDIGTTVDDSRPDPRAVSEFASLVMDLADQFTGGSKDQGGGVSLTGATVRWSAGINWGRAGTLREGSRKDREEETGGFT